MSAHPKSRHGYGGIWGGERNSLPPQPDRPPGRPAAAVRLHREHQPRGRPPQQRRLRPRLHLGVRRGVGQRHQHRRQLLQARPDHAVRGRPGHPEREPRRPVVRRRQPGRRPSGRHRAQPPRIRYPIGGINELSKPQPFADELEPQSAAKAYDAVLANAGAVLPRRDAADARIVNDARNGTGRLINSQKEVGGFPVLASTEAAVDSDHDGIPDWWEKANGLDPNDPSDAQKIAPNGYTYLENYLNSIVPDPVGNPTVEITSPKFNQTIPGRTAPTVTVEADAAAAKGGELAKVEFFAGDQLIGTATESAVPDPVEERCRWLLLAHRPGHRPQRHGDPVDPGAGARQPAGRHAGLDVGGRRQAAGARIGQPRRRDPDASRAPAGSWAGPATSTTSTASSRSAAPDRSPDHRPAGQTRQGGQRSHRRADDPRQSRPGRAVHVRRDRVRRGRWYRHDRRRRRRCERHRRRRHEGARRSGSRPTGRRRVSARGRGPRTSTSTRPSSTGCGCSGASVRRPGRSSSRPS